MHPAMILDVGRWCTTICAFETGARAIKKSIEGMFGRNIVGGLQDSELQCQ